MTSRKSVSEFTVDEKTLAEIAQACHLTVSQIEDVYPCLPQQISQIDDSRSEQFQILVNFGPDADLNRWCDALRQVVAANSTLRTRIVKTRVGIVQVVTTEEHHTERHTGDVEKYVRDGKLQLLGFGDLLFRSVIINRTFIAIIHHAVMDHSSISTLFKEDVGGVFLGQGVNRRPEYREFVDYYSDIDEPVARSFWASRFKGAPTIYPSVPVGHSPYPYGVAIKTMPLNLQEMGISPLHVPLYIEAAWALTAAIYSNSDNIAYGLVLSGRGPSTRGLEKTLGQTVVEIPIQVRLQRNMTIEQLVKERATSLRKLQAEPSIQYGLDSIASVSDAARIAAGFQTQLNIIPFPRTQSNKKSAPKNSDVEMDRIVWMAKGAFSLMLPCYIGPEQIFVEAKYDPVSIPECQVNRVLNQFDHILQRLLVAPMHLKLSQLQLFSSNDMAEATQWNKVLPKGIEKLIYHDLMVVAQLRPNDFAVKAIDGQVSYSELNQLSNNFAQELHRRGIERGEPILIAMERSLAAVIALIGITKAGAICVPISEGASHNQNSALASSVKAKLGLSSPIECHELACIVREVLYIDMASISKLPNADEQIHGLTVSTRDIAFIFSTNGSTTAPKDVVVDHRSLVSNLAAVCSRLDWQSSNRILHIASLSDFASIYEIFGCFSLGKCLCIPPEARATAQIDLYKYISSFDVDTALLPARVFRTMRPYMVSCLRSLTSFGDAMDNRTLADWSKATRIFNCWGVCEASMLNTISEQTAQSSDPRNIGRPVGCAVWIVNSNNPDELVPIGSVGELLIEGPSLSSGYLHNASKTKTSFLPPPTWAASFGRNLGHFLRTGDLGRYAPDGSIIFVGKKENCIRLGTHTVQLEEFENILFACPEVRDIVTSVKITAGRTQLFAVVALADPRLPSHTALQEFHGIHSNIVQTGIDSIRKYAENHLPYGRIPDFWIAVEKLPRTSSRRLNRGAVRSWLKTLRQ